MAVVTQKEIARKLGVSRELVSLILNGKRPVRNSIHQKILDEGMRQGYMPNSAARSLKQQRFNQIACIVTCYGPRGMAPTICNGYLDAIADYLGEQGYSVIFESFHLDALTNEFIEMPRLFSELAVDGVIAVDGTDVVPQYVDSSLSGMSAPIVWVNRNPNPDVVNIISDEVYNSFVLVEHLLELGHKKIGYFGNEALHYSSKARYEAIFKKLQASGYDTSAVINSDYHDDGGAILKLTQLLDSNPDMTALICYNLPFYHVALQVAAQRGIKVPRDLSLCAFASAWEVPLLMRYPCTVSVVSEPEMGRTAAGILVEHINAKKPVKPHVPPEIENGIRGRLLEGFTTAPPGKDAEFKFLNRYIDERKR